MFNKTSKNIASGKSAFTLAEVLITLLVIGIVAAITIPTLIQKYSNHSLYSGFMKVYNTITNALEMSKAENGAIETWSVDPSNHDSAKEEYIYKYLSYSKIIDTSTQDSGFDYDVKALSGDAAFNVKNADMGKVALLQDGSWLALEFIGDNIIDFIFDTNGFKGPNVIGRDLFIMEYRKNRDENKWEFDVDTDFGPEDCNSSGVGQGCAARLLLEGKMNY